MAAILPSSCRHENTSKNGNANKLPEYQRGSETDSYDKATLLIVMGTVVLTLKTTGAPVLRRGIRWYLWLSQDRVIQGLLAGDDLLGLQSK